MAPAPRPRSMLLNEPKCYGGQSDVVYSNTLPKKQTAPKPTPRKLPSMSTVSYINDTSESKNEEKVNIATQNISQQPLNFTKSENNSVKSVKTWNDETVSKIDLLNEISSQTNIENQIKVEIQHGTKTARTVNRQHTEESSEEEPVVGPNSGVHVLVYIILTSSLVINCLSMLCNFNITYTVDFLLY